MGIGFSRYLMNIRLKRAMKELLYTVDSISQIAMNTGFPNTKTFSTIFKEVYGMTPHVYQKPVMLKKRFSSSLQQGRRFTFDPVIRDYSKIK